MHITAYDLRLHFQQCFQSSDCLTKCFYCPQIFQVSHIWGRIKTVIHTDAEGVFEFSTDCEHLSLIWCGNHKRKWCITSGTADHIWFILIKIHYRIVCADTDLAVMGQHAVAESRQFCLCFPIVTTDRRTGYISTGHYQKFRHFNPVIIRKDQKLYRCIWQHHTDFWIARCHGWTEDLSLFFLIQKQDRLLMSVENFGLFCANFTFFSDSFGIFCHHCKRLHRTTFELPQAADCPLI